MSAVIQDNTRSRKALERSGYSHVYTERNEQYSAGKLHHLEHLECLSPLDPFWSTWWHDDPPTAKALEARQLTEQAMAWARENVTLP